MKQFLQIRLGDANLEAVSPNPVATPVFRLVIQVLA